MLILDKQANEPLYLQLYNGIREEILNGQLEKDSALVPVRVLAKSIGVGKNTVENAYQKLVSEGYVRTVPGSGYYVEGVFTSEEETERREQEAEMEHGVEYNFTVFEQNPKEFFWYRWEKYVRDACVEEKNRTNLSRYSDNKGVYELRYEICRFVQRHRGVSCSPNQIVVWPDTQSVMLLIADLFPKEKYKIAFEDPADKYERNVFERNGYTVKPISVTENGIDIEELYRSDCNLLYITSQQQFPIGTTLTEKKRLEILKWAEDRDGYIVEFDAGDFCSTRNEIPSLQYYDQSDRVIYVGNLSRSMMYAVFFTFLVLPATMIDDYEDIYRHPLALTPEYHQKAMANFMKDGLLDKLIQKNSVKNNKKFQIFQGAVKKYLSEYMECCSPLIGNYCLVRIHVCKEQKKLLRIFRRNSVRIQGIQKYFVEKQKENEKIFLVGFSMIQEELLVDACKKIREVLENYVNQSAHAKKREVLGCHGYDRKILPLQIMGYGSTLFRDVTLMEKTGQLMWKSQNLNFYHLPFVLNLEAISLGAGVYGAKNYFAIDSYPYERIMDIQIQRGELRRKLEIQALCTYIEKVGGEKVILDIEGPFSVLAGLINPIRLFTEIKNNKEQVKKLLADIVEESVSYVSEVMHRGVNIFFVLESEIDPTTLGGDFYREYAGWAIWLLLKKLKTNMKKGVFLLCKKTTAELERAEYICTKEQNLEVDLEYGAMKRIGENGTQIFGNVCLFDLNVPRTNLTKVEIMEEE